MEPALARMLSDLTPLPGVLKLDYEDFVVEELPLYPAAGEGSHTYFQIEKRGLSTMHAVRDIARALDVRPIAIGYAGLKDARAVTRQWMSVEHVPPAQVEALQIPRLRICAVSMHRNKLRLGHLAGNRFSIRMRDTQPHRLDELRAALSRLTEAGVPNYFGAQRFGMRGDGWRVGQAIVRDDLRLAVDLMLGQPREDDPVNLRTARELYEAQRYDAAAGHWPAMFRDERRALKALARGGNHKRAFLSIDEGVRRLLISAWQSWLFNRIVVQRLQTGLQHLMAGDLAWRHGNGAVFRVEDVAVEQPRADAFEISPSGPLFGYRMTPAEGVPGEMEAALAREEGLDQLDLRSRHLRLKGARRPLRFPLRAARAEAGMDEHSSFLRLSFELPAGCYATSVLRELFEEPSSDPAAALAGGDELAPEVAP